MVYRKRKQYASKKKAAKYARRKAKVSYPDRHNWKLDAGANVIYNSSAGVCSAAGTSITIGKFVAQRNNYTQFGGAFDFNLNKCLSTTSYLAANFDRYKINAIKINVIPENNFANVSGQGILPTMKVVYDYDDSNVPSVGDVEVRRGKTYRLDKPFSIYLSPKVGSVIYNTQTNSGTSPLKAPWLNMSSLLIPHFGVKFMVRDWYAPQTLNDIQVRFVITYMVSVKEQIAVGRAPSLIEDQDVRIPAETGPDEEPESLYNPVRPTTTLPPA